MKSIFHRLLFLLFGTGFSVLMNSQSIEEQMKRTNPDCQTFFVNAMNVIPEQYNNRSFDSIQKALDIWERFCGQWNELKIIKLLADIETDRFSMRDKDGSLLVLLTEYSQHFPEYNPGNRGQVNGPVNSFFSLSFSWAKNLLNKGKLDTNEKFICKVIAREINDPQKEIQKTPQSYPDFTALRKEVFDEKRKHELRANYSFNSGIWIPTNDLSVIGNHPFLGFNLGARDPHFQIDFTLQFRFSKSPVRYKFSGLPDSSDAYMGIYLGLDFIYYPIVKTRFDFGIIGGIGGDVFDPQKDDNGYYNESLVFDSWNFNTGLRFNYYINSFFYIGFESRYNFLNYSNDLGGKINGDALSSDLILGFNKKRKRRY